MPTSRRIHHSFREQRVPGARAISLARLVAAFLPLTGLAMPLSAHAGTPAAIAICSGGEERVIALPVRESPSRRNDDQQACAHLICPRERAQGDAAGEEEE